MLKRLQRTFQLLSRQLWLRTSLYAVIGVAAALLGLGADRYLPWTHPIGIPPNAVNRILDILASSMLTVTTFSLGIIVTAYGMATASVSPRAARLLTEDIKAQRTLATFLGSFLFSLVSIIALSTGLYGDRGRSILFLATIVMVLIVVFTILRSISQLAKLGRVDTATQRVEEVTREAIDRWVADPYGGANPMPPHTEPPPGAAVIVGREVGYVGQIDYSGLHEIAEQSGTEIYVGSPSGTFSDGRRPLVWIVGEGAASVANARKDDVRTAFVIEPERSFDNDVRYGLVVLSEIASRALSPAINDPGTAIDVIGRGTRLFATWNAAVTAQQSKEAKGITCPRLHVPMLTASDMLNDLFRPIARDGAGNIEVQIRLQKALAAIAATGRPEVVRAAHQQATAALKRAEGELMLEDDKQLLRNLLAKWPGSKDGNAMQLS